MNLHRIGQVTYLVTGIGTTFAVSNAVISMIDYLEGKSSNECSAKELKMEMIKQRKNETLLDLFKVMFRRGSEGTRNPANFRNFLISLFVIIGYYACFALAYRSEKIIQTFAQF